MPQIPPHRPQGLGGRAHEVADTLERTIVINGDVIDPEILDEASVSECEAIIAVTNDDETNILASLLAKRFGTKRAVTLINNVTYSPLITSLGIDVVVSPRAITVSTILQHVRRGKIRAVHSLAEAFGELIEAEILETSGLSGHTISDADLPDGVLFGAIVRDDAVIIPRADTVMRVHDRVVLFAEASAVRAIENLFAAVELMAKSYLLMSPDTRLLEKTRHRFVDKEFNRYGKHGNVPRDFVRLFNTLTNRRNTARFPSAPLGIGASKLDAWLKTADEMDSHLDDVRPKLAV